ncbi:MAG: tetratricopeptide repeat protein, partial [Planctomycetota bacterium]|nr:tetratricopeptide repeat protein [Planctomycetota bacterium]
MATPTPKDASMLARWLALLSPLVVALLALAAFSNGADGVFVFDDHIDITDNVAIREPWPPWRVILDQGQSGVSGRPLVALSYALNHEAFGYATPGWHWTNVVVHLLVALAVLGCVRRALELPRFAARWGTRARWIALVVASTFAVHPFATGVVMYRGQRVESMMALFFALTLYAAFRSFASPDSKGWRRLAVLACWLGTGCKEVIVGAPLLVLLFDALFVSGSWKGALAARRGMYAGLFASWLAIVALVVLAQGRSESVGFDYGHVGLWSYLTTQAWAVPEYLRLCLWPNPLVFDYGTQPVVDVGSWLPGALVVLTLLAATAYGLLRRNGLAFLGAVWFVILAPTSSFLPIVTELVVKHRAYLPSAAVHLALVLAVATLLERLPSAARVAAAAIALGVVGTFAALTHARNEVYKSELGLWADTVAKVPHNARAQACYGNDLRVAGRVDEAGERYKEAARLDPENPDWAANWGTWLLDRGRYDEAIVHLRLVRDEDPDNDHALYMLAVAHAQRGEHAESIAHLERAIALNPENRALAR